MRSVSKQQLVNGVSGRLEMQKNDVEKVLNAIIDELKDCFRKGERVEIHNFGTFLPQRKKARMVTVPSTKEKHLIKARTILKFKTSKYMTIYEDKK